MKDEDSKNGGIITAGIIAALVFATAFFYVVSMKQSTPLWDIPTSKEEAEKAYAYVPNPNSTFIQFTEGVNAWYVSETLGFSFRLPDGFSAPDGKLKDSNTYVAQLSNGKGNDLHIVARKITAGADTQLSEEIIRTQATEENLSEFRAGSLKEGTGGIFFESDSQEWGGNALAFWFTKGGYLYTLTTDKKDAELLDLVMQTWRFGAPVAPLPR